VKRYWMLDTRDSSVIERVWTLTQYSGYSMPMYRSRVSTSHVAWVIETLDDPSASRLLLEFSNNLISITGTVYSHA
jgi:hypothetical protein